MEQDLSSVTPFGTDDEKALTNAFNNNFQFAARFLCDVHLKKNAKSKRISLGIKEDLKDEITADIYGKVVISGILKKKSNCSSRNGLMPTENELNFTNGLLKTKEMNL